MSESNIGLTVYGQAASVELLRPGGVNQVRIDSVGTLHASAEDGVLFLTVAWRSGGSEEPSSVAINIELTPQVKGHLAHILETSEDYKHD